jgi:hypothetical protein
MSKLLLCNFLAAILFSGQAHAQTTGPTTFGFDFCSAAAVAGKAHVAPEMIYFNERGFGFEPGAELKQTDSVGSSPG